MNFLKMFSFLKNQDDSNIELDAIKLNQQGFHQLSDLRKLDKACNKKLDYVKTILDDMKPLLDQSKQFKTEEEKLRFKIHECSNELELAKAQINKISEFKLQENNVNKQINEILKIVLEKFVIVRQQLLETINSFQENQSNQIVEQKKTIKRLSEIYINETDQQQKQRYEQSIYDEQYILNQRQQQIQEILFQLKNVVEMVQYIDQKVDDQGLMIGKINQISRFKYQILTQTEETKDNTEKTRQELVKFQRINKNECSNVAFCFLLGTIVVVVMLAATA